MSSKSLFLLCPSPSLFSWFLSLLKYWAIVQTVAWSNMFRVLIWHDYLLFVIIQQSITQKT